MSDPSVNPLSTSAARSDADVPCPRADADRPPGALNYGDYSESGVDLSLLRYMLSLSPLERLVRMEQHAQDTLTLLEYGRRHREAEAAADP